MKKILIGLALAAVTGMSAQASSIAPDFSSGAMEGDTAVLFAEQAGVSVAADQVTVDFLVGTNLNAGDSFTGVNSQSGGVALTQGVYDSFLIHFDPTDSGTTAGSFTFTTNIVAVIVSNAGGGQLLSTSDAVFGATDAVYDPAIARRSEITDTFTLTDANTISFSFITAPGFVDNVRVITAASVPAVPLPASMPLLVAGLGGLAMMRRRRKS